VDAVIEFPVHRPPNIEHLQVRFLLSSLSQFLATWHVLLDRGCTTKLEGQYDRQRQISKVRATAQQ
jgi:hypothetical protein